MITFQCLYLSNVSLINRTKMRICGAVLRGTQRCYTPSSSYNLLVRPNARALSVPTAQTTRLRCMSTVASIPLYQYHPDFFIGAILPSPHTTALATESRVTMASIPSYQPHPDFPSGVTPHSSPPKTSYVNTSSHLPIALLMKTSYTTAFALFEALWEVGLALPPRLLRPEEPLKLVLGWHHRMFHQCRLRSPVHH